jgi:fructokinase
VSAIDEVVRHLKQRAGAEATVGLGMPGSISPRTGLVQNANSTWLNDRPFARDLEAKLGISVRLANDANCFALSEAVDGAGAQAFTVFGVILGTGCGGGLVIDRKVIDGPRGIAGEWGHNPLPWSTASEHPGPTCWCGRKSCMETWVSGPGVEADHARMFGERLSCEAIAARAASGDQAAQTSTHMRDASHVAWLTS